MRWLDDTRKRAGGKLWTQIAQDRGIYDSRGGLYPEMDVQIDRKELISVSISRFLCVRFISKICF